MLWSRSVSRLCSRRRSRRPETSLQVLEQRTLLAGDGLGTFAPSTGTWTLRDSADAGEPDIEPFQFGARKVAVVGDWDGDGTDDIGAYDRNTGTWTLRLSASPGDADITFQFGRAGSDPVSGDWDGDGTDEIGVYHWSTQTWYLRSDASAGPADVGVFRFGTSGAAPVVGDWDGDGIDGIGVVDRRANTWSLRQTPTAGTADLQFTFGGDGIEAPVAGDWDGDGTDGIGYYVASTGTWTLKQDASAGEADAGVFVFGKSGTTPVVGDFLADPDPEPEPEPIGTTLLTLTVKPLDLDLLGLEITSSPITVTVSTVEGDGNLLGNVLGALSGIINEEVNNALNNVLGTTVDLLNSVELEVLGVGEGVFSSAPESTTPILELFVAPVHLDLLGVVVTTSEINLDITAHAGEGKVLGNALTALTDLFNPPLPEQLDVAFLNERLDQLIADLNTQIPGIPAATVPPPVISDEEFLEVTVPAIDLNLLGLVLETEPITVNASAISGDGKLLGNLLTVVFNTLEATPEELSELSDNINQVLAKVVGVLNASTLTLPDGALGSLSDALQTLALPDLITAEPGASTTILDLVIASSDGTTPPVNVDLLGLNITTSEIDARLSAVTGEGQVLGNLLYNVANLLNPGGPGTLITLITDLATGSNLTGDLLGPLTSPTTPAEPVEVLTVVLPPLDIDLLGLEVTSSEITVTISAQEGDGKLLGNVITGLTTIINTEGVANALNNVLDTTVGLLNSVDLEVDGLLGDIAFNGTPESTPVLQLFVAPVVLDLLGVIVETSPITLNITAHSGEGLVLGNALTALTDILNPPLPEQIDLAFINGALNDLLDDLNAVLPGIPGATVPPPTLDEGQILELTVPAVDLNLLGLILETAPITVNATAETGDGLLLGNLLTVVLDTLQATPAELSELNANLNDVLAKVIGTLNASSLILSPDTLSLLAAPLQTLASPTLINAEPGATTQILDLVIASTDGTTPPVQVDLLGVTITTSDIDAQLSAETGEGQLLGNLLYNVSNLLNGDSSAALLFLLSQLGRL